VDHAAEDSNAAVAAGSARDEHLAVGALTILEDGSQQVFLGFEVVEQPGTRDADIRCDLDDRRALESSAREDLRRRLDDRLATAQTLGVVARGQGDLPIPTSV
jgi:hypothetical protein